MSLLLIALAVMVAFTLFRWFAARRQASAESYGQPAMARSGYGNADLGPEGQPASSTWNTSGGSSAQMPAGSTASPVALEAQSSVSAQEIADFLKVAREQFTRLQSIWDSGDIHGLAEFCTPEMTRELSHQIADRKGAANVTQVVSLNADWLGMADSADDFGKPVDEVRIRFSGLIRESAGAAAEDFSEVWTLHRIKGGDTGWLLAGIAQT